MAIKHEIKIDKENKVLTLMVSVSKKKLAKEENVSFRGVDAWEIAKNIAVKGYKVEYKNNGLIVDNWRICNHEGIYNYSLIEEKVPKVKTNSKKTVKKTKVTARKSKRTKSKE